jgi:hypothetical protein
MSTSRDVVLGHIRRAIAGSNTPRTADYEAIPRGYIRSGGLDPRDRLELFQ